MKQKLILQIQEITNSKAQTISGLRNAIERYGNKKAEKLLDKVLKIEVKEEAARRKAISIGIANAFKMSLRKYLTLHKKAQDILYSFHTGHSMGCYRSIHVNGRVFATLHDLKEYSNSCKYSPTYGSIHIEMTKSDLEKIEVKGGVWTITQKDHKAKWLNTSGIKSSCRVYFENGFYVGTSHGTTLFQCLKLEKEKLRKLNLKKSSFIGVQDIKKIGACDPGIDSFCQRNNIDKEQGYRIDFLLGLNDPYGSSYFNRLIS